MAATPATYVKLVATAVVWGATWIAGRVAVSEASPLAVASWRFLLAAPAKDGYVELDFNRAHNPPCAFTPYATCPVPLAENRLPVRVTAGEQLPADHS